MHACIHTYIHIYIHLYVYMYMYIYMYIYACTCVYLHIHRHTYIYIYMNIHPHMSMFSDSASKDFLARAGLLTCTPRQAETFQLCLKGIRGAEKPGCHLEVRVQALCFRSKPWALTMVPESGTLMYHVRRRSHTSNATQTGKKQVGAQIGGQNSNGVLLLGTCCAW